MANKLILTFMTAAFLAVPQTSFSAGIFGTKLSSKKVDSILASHMGGLSASLELQGMQCLVSRLKFQNLQTGKKYQATNYLYARDTRQSLNLIAVTPGQYKLISGSCDVGYKTYAFKDITKGYGPITVRPGEVVYPGTFSVNRAGRSLKGYDLQNHTAMKANALMRKYPRLAQRFVPRPVYTPLSSSVASYAAYGQYRR